LKEGRFVFLAQLGIQNAVVLPFIN